MLPVARPATLLERSGEVTEWPIVRHWKCRVLGNWDRGFESPPLRSLKFCAFLTLIFAGFSTFVGFPCEA